MANRFSRKDFLEALFGEYASKRDGFVRVMTVRQFDKKLSTRYFPKIETLAKEQYQDNQHVFFGVCPHESMKADKSGIRYLVAIWAGLDLGREGYSGKECYFSDMSYAAKAVRSFPLPPSIVVESGWGVHLYWLLNGITEITDPKRVERLLSRISEYFQCKREIGIDSVLRLPDTFNCKVPSSLLKCSVKYLNPEFRYDFEELEQLKLVSVFPDSPTAAAGSEPLEKVVETTDDLGLSVNPDAAAAAGASYQESVQPFVDQDLSRSQVAPPPAPAAAPIPTPPEPVRFVLPPAPSPSTFEEPEETDEETIVVVAEASSDTLADEIVERVVEKLSSELMEKLVDEIVDKLYKRITNTGKS